MFVFEVESALLVVILSLFTACGAKATVSTADVISSDELGSGMLLDDNPLVAYISGLATGPCSGAVAWNAGDSVGKSLETEINGERVIIVHFVTLTQNAPAVVVDLAADLGDGCEPEVDLIGDPADIEAVVARLDLGDLGGTAWTIEVDANGVLSHGASHYVADGDSKLSAVEVASPVGTYGH